MVVMPALGITKQRLDRRLNSVCKYCLGVCVVRRLCPAHHAGRVDSGPKRFPV
jgi:hypothetical protein